jgi:hypothetical protein
MIIVNQGQVAIIRTMAKLTPSKEEGFDNLGNRDLSNSATDKNTKTHGRE